MQFFCKTPEYISSNIQFFLNNFDSITFNFLKYQSKTLSTLPSKYFSNKFKTIHFANEIGSSTTDGDLKTFLKDSETESAEESSENELSYGNKNSQGFDSGNQKHIYLLAHNTSWLIPCEIYVDLQMESSN